MTSPHTLPHDEALKARRDADIESLPAALQERALDMVEWMLRPEDAEQVRAWFRHTGWDWVEKNHVGESWGLQVQTALSHGADPALLAPGRTWADYYPQLLEIAVGLRPDFREEPDYVRSPDWDSDADEQARAVPKT